MRYPVVLGCALACLFLASCATPPNPKAVGKMRYSAFSGPDAMEFETSTGALAETAYELPVYRGWPNKPFVIIGSIHHVHPRRMWREAELRDGAKLASLNGGDALIVRRGSEFGVVALTGFTSGSTQEDSMIYRPDQENAFVIRWKTAEEIRKTDERQKNIRENLLMDKPYLKHNSDVYELVLKFVAQSTSFDDPDLVNKVKQALSKLENQANEGFSGQWVFKVILTERQIAHMNQEQFPGIATVISDGDQITIVSTEGRREINFSGKLSQKSLAGRVGVAGFSAKAEGVALTDKISLNFQGQSPNGTLNGTLVLQRPSLKQNQN